MLPLIIGISHSLRVFRLTSKLHRFPSLFPLFKSNQRHISDELLFFINYFRSNRTHSNNFFHTLDRIICLSWIQAGQVRFRRLDRNKQCHESETSEIMSTYPYCDSLMWSINFRLLKELLRNIAHPDLSNCASVF